MTDVATLLTAEFPKEAIHWRAQSVKKDGSKAMALAYIDARDVMDRLDIAVGPENWQDTFTETAKGRVVCKLSIRFGDDWITKSDGAGDTAVEGEKGGISDAFKRAAVKWGIGRYLYDMPTPWVPCESYEKNGRRHWRKWTSDPWSYVNRREPKITEAQVDDLMAQLKARRVTTTEFLRVCKLDSIGDLTADRFDGARDWILEQNSERKAA